MDHGSLSMKQGILEARYTHQEISRKYNWIAPIYDMFGILMESKARQRALEIAAIRNGEKVSGSRAGNRTQLRRDPEEKSEWDGWMESTSPRR